MTVQQPTLSQIAGAQIANQQILIANTTAVGGSNVYSDANLTFDYANGLLTVTHANANATYNIAIFQGAPAAVAQNQNSEWVTIATRKNSAACLSLAGNGATFSVNDAAIFVDWTSHAYLYQRSTFDWAVGTNATLRQRWDKGGNVYFGTAAGSTSTGAPSPPNYFGGNPGYWFAGSGNQSFPCFSRYEATPFGCSLGFYKSRNGNVGQRTAAVVGDNPGDIVWINTDGTNDIPCARILPVHDGNPGINLMPTALTFLTTNTSAGNTETECFRLTGSGSITSGAGANTVLCAGLNHKMTIAFDGGSTLYGIGLVANSTASNVHFMTFANNAAPATALAQISANTTTTAGFFAISDHRLKSNVANLENGINIIMSMKPRTYDWHTGEKGIGFIAHELQEALPVGSHAVMGHKDKVDANGRPEHQMVDLASLVPHLVAAIQDQQYMIIDLQNQIKALKSNN